MASKVLAGSTVEVQLYSSGSGSGRQYIVAYYIDGAVWDWDELETLADAQAVFDDPLAACRPACVEETEEIDRSYIELATRISRGRRIGKKPGAA